MTTIFFELHGVLIDPEGEREAAALAQAQVLSTRFGTSVEAWLKAGQQIEADWDSYYADLDLGGDEGYRDFLEGEFRTLRARFRLTDTPEPTAAVIRSLADDLAYTGASAARAWFPDIGATVEALHQAGHRLGIVTNRRTAYIRGMLEGGDLAGYFTGPFIGVDTVEQFVKDAMFYRKLTLAAAQCLIVDRDSRSLDAAREAGFQTALFWRGNYSALTPSPSPERSLPKTARLGEGSPMQDIRENTRAVTWRGSEPPTNHSHPVIESAMSLTQWRAILDA